MSENILNLILQIVVIALPVILGWVFTKLGITKQKYQQWQWAVEKAFEFVMAARDKFPDNAGAQKLAWAVEQLRNALIQIGYHATDEEIEAMVRSAYRKMKIETGEAIVGESSAGS